MREEDAAIDEERLFGNALSSMPLCFNLFAPLALDLNLATAVFRRLLPEFVHTVEQVIFEHSPGRREDRFLAGRTAFDLAVRVTTLLPCERFSFSECAIQISKGMRCPAIGLASVFRPERLLEVFLGLLFAAEHASDGGLQWLWYLPLDAPDTCRIFDQIGHRAHQKLPMFAASQEQTKL